MISTLIGHAYSGKTCGSLFCLPFFFARVAHHSVVLLFLILLQVFPAPGHSTLEMLSLSALLYCAVAGFSLPVVAAVQLLRG